MCMRLRLPLLLLLWAVLIGGIACGGEDEADTYYVAGMVEGLEGPGLVLSNNGEQEIAVDEDGEFWFAETFADGHEYDVRVATAPSQQECDIANGSGVIDGANVVDITVTCTVVEEQESAYFDVAIDESESTLQVADGDVVEIKATVYNQGDRSGTQDVELTIDGEVFDTRQDLTIDGEDSEVLTFEWPTESGEFGTYNAVLSTEDTSDSATIEVAPPFGTAYFDLSLNEGVSVLDVVGGEAVKVRGTVSNIGDVLGTQDVTLSVGGEVVDTRTVELEGGNTDSLEMQWLTDAEDAGDHTLTFATDDDSHQVEASVAIPPDPAFFALTLDEAQSTFDVEAGQTMTVVVDVENTGEVSGTQDLILDLGDGLEVRQDDVSIDGGDSDTITFSWDTTTDDIGHYSAAITSDDDSIEDLSAFVFPPPGTAHFEVTVDDAASATTVEHGETISVVVAIENLGDTADTQDLALSIDGVEQGLAEDISLDGGDTTTATLTWATEVGDAGIYPAAVTSNDDTADIELVVIDPDVISVSGDVVDTQGLESLEGVEIALVDVDTDDTAATTTVGSDGFYWLEVEEPGDYALVLRAPGLEPGYTVEETGGDNEIVLSLAPGPVAQDLSIDWARTTDLVFQGGLFDLQYGAADGSDIAFDVPGCTEQSDGTWVSDGAQDNASFVPDDACFLIRDVAIDLHTGDLSASADDVDFPQIFLEFGGGDSFEFEDILSLSSLEMEWAIDAIGGTVDFRQGSLDVAMDARILLGGTASAIGGIFGEDVEFGTTVGDNDCQLTGAWGGNINDPTSDTEGLQQGDYLHDPIAMELTTGASGSAGIEGQSFDEATGTWTIVDNAMSIGALSELDDPAGSACGEADLQFFSEDISALLNEALSLPNSGQTLGEFEVSLP